MIEHKWPYHLDTRAGTVPAPHDFVVNVQKRLGIRSYTGEGGCRLCGTFLDPRLEHGEICSILEATRGHYARVRALFGGLTLADPGVTTEPRGVTDTTSRRAVIFTTAAVPGCGAALDVLPCSSSTKRCSTGGF